jgi:hypothetical protein
MTLGEFSQGLQQHGCDLIDGGLFNGYRTVIARRETDRVRLFVFLDEGQDVVLPERFQRAAFNKSFPIAQPI